MDSPKQSSEDYKHFLDIIIKENELIEKDLDTLDFSHIDPELFPLFLQKIEQADDNNYVENNAVKDLDIQLIFKTLNAISKKIYLPCKGNWTISLLKKNISEYYKFPLEYMTLVINDEVMEENTTLDRLNTDTVYVILTTKTAHPYKDNFTVAEARAIQDRWMKSGEIQPQKNFNEGTSVDPDGADKLSSLDSFQSMESDSSPSPTKRMFLDLNTDKMDVD